MRALALRSLALRSRASQLGLIGELGLQVLCQLVQELEGVQVVTARHSVSRGRFVEKLIKFLLTSYQANMYLRRTIISTIKKTDYHPTIVEPNRKILNRFLSHESTKCKYIYIVFAHTAQSRRYGVHLVDS